MQNREVAKVTTTFACKKCGREKIHESLYYGSMWELTVLTKFGAFIRDIIMERQAEDVVCDKCNVYAGEGSIKSVEVELR